MNMRKNLAVLVAGAMLLSMLSIGVVFTAAESYTDGASYKEITDVSLLPESESLIAGKIATETDGTVKTVYQGSLDQITDGKYQGLNQSAQFKVCNTSSAVSGTTTYYNHRVPAELITEMGLDESKDWYFQPENKFYSTTTVSATRACLHKNTPKLMYDLGSTCAINRVLLASTSECGSFTAAVTDEAQVTTIPYSTITSARNSVSKDSRMLYRARVYVGDVTGDELFSDAHLVLDYTFNDKEYARAYRNLWTLADTANGRYIGFDFTGGTDNLGGNQVRISELAVYGAAASRVDLNSSDNAAALPADANLLAEHTMYNGFANPGTAYEFPMSGAETDGRVYGISSMNGAQNVVSTYYSGLIVNPGGQSADTGIEGVKGWANVYYAMEQPVTFNRVLVAGSYGDNPAFDQGGILYNNQVVQKWEAYACNDRATLFDAANLVYTCDNSVTKAAANYIRLDTPVTAQYIGFRLTTGAYDQARVSELGIYAPGGTTYTASGYQTTELTNSLVREYGYDAEGNNRSLINGKISQIYSGGKLVDLGGGSAVYATDGNIYGYSDPAAFTSGSLSEEKGKWTPVNCTNGSCYGRDNNYSWAQGLYDLGSNKSVDTFIIADHTDTGSNRLPYGKVYVSDTLGNLFAPQNCVAEYHDTDTVSATATAVHGQLITLDKPVVGRYVGFAFGAGQYSQCRIGELMVMESTALQLTQIDDASGAAAIPTKRNVLKGITPATGISPISNVTGLTDGIILHVNTEDAENNKNSSFNGGAMGLPTARITFDLGQTEAVDTFLAASSYSDSRSYPVRWTQYYRFYISEDADTLYNDENMVICYDNTALNLAQVFTLGTPVSGRYIGVKASGDMMYGAVRFTELGAYAATTATLGAQVRGDTGAALTGPQAMRFGTQVYCTGAVADADFNADLTGATVNVDGTDYAVTGIGTLVARAVKAGAAELTVDTSNTAVVDIPATKLFSVGSDRVSFTAVITNVPETKHDEQILARAYVAYTDGHGDTQYLYGAAISRSINNVRVAAEN